MIAWLNHAIYAQQTLQQVMRERERLHALQGPKWRDDGIPLHDEL